jgi:putative membrane protein
MDRRAYLAAMLLAVGTPAAAHAAVSGDRAFVTLAMNGNTSEIREGDIWADSSDHRVEAFANRMVQDHSQANTQLISLAHSMHVSTTGQLPEFPYTSGVQHAASLTPAAKANAMHGMTPQAFFSQQIRIHQQQIAMYKHEIAAGKNPMVVSYARKTLPIIEQHLKLAQQDLRDEKEHKS